MSVTENAMLQRAARGLFRMMLSGIFIVAGINHLTKPEQIASRLEAAPFGFVATTIADPKTLVLLAAVPLLIGGLMLLVGIRTRLAATVLLAMIIPITFSVQIGDAATLGPLFKNIGLAGGLIFFTAHGADAWSFDARHRRPRATQNI